MSTIKVTNLQDTSGGNSSTTEQISQGRAKAWLSFTGEGTIAIQNSFNISSIGDEGTGKYSINFSTAFSNTDYVYVSGIHDGGGFNDLRGWNHESSSTKTTTTFDVYQVDNNLNPNDPEYGYLVFFGD